jgi:hypothetical protein
VHLVLEHDGNAADHLRRGFDAQWNDDAHHALHVLLTGEKVVYYRDYAQIRQASLHAAWPKASPIRASRRPIAKAGAAACRAATCPPTAFVLFLQNHDQIGNRPLGDRLTTLADPEALAAAVALQLLSPSIPLLFMGEELLSRQPFQFFTDFHGALADAVREGRRREFASFSGFADKDIPDPNAAGTFDRSRQCERAMTDSTDGSSLCAARSWSRACGGAHSLGAMALGPAAVLGALAHGRRRHALYRGQSRQGGLCTDGAARHAHVRDTRQGRRERQVWRSRVDGSLPGIAMSEPGDPRPCQGKRYRRRLDRCGRAAAPGLDQLAYAHSRGARPALCHRGPTRRKPRAPSAAAGEPASPDDDRRRCHAAIDPDGRGERRTRFWKTAKPGPSRSRTPSRRSTGRLSSAALRQARRSAWPSRRPRCVAIADISRDRKLWGLAVQLYSLRRSGDGGIGDTTALAALAESAARLGADAIALSPTHSLFPADPSRYGPYAPSSRLFLNPLLADPAEVFGQRRVAAATGPFAPADGPLIDWPSAAVAKYALLSACSTSSPDSISRRIRRLLPASAPSSARVAPRSRDIRASRPARAGRR